MSGCAAAVAAKQASQPQLAEVQGFKIVHSKQPFIISFESLLVVYQHTTNSWIGYGKITMFRPDHSSCFVKFHDAGSRERW